MNNLFFTDIHISKDSLGECSKILEEILILCDKHRVDNVYDLGDTFDVLKPGSEELDLFADFIKRLNRPIIILAANSHESTSQEESIVNHFGVLNDKVKVVKEYIDETHLYCGHFTLAESKKNYGSSKSKESLKEYKYVLLGHQHQPELIKPNVCHLGSVRYVNFDEYKDRKQVLIIQNYKEKGENCLFLPLLSPVPMKIVEISSLPEKSNSSSSSVKSAEGTITYLDSLDPETKVKVRILDFSAYKKFLSLSVAKSYDKKFTKFIQEQDFQLVTELASDTEKKELVNLKDSFVKFAEERKVNDEIKNIILEEIK